MTTIQQAAAEIAALINSRPTSPGEAEIAAIVARAVASSLHLREEPALALEFRRLQQRADAAYNGGVSDEAATKEGDRLSTEAARLSEFVYSTPPRSIADLYVRAEIARYWHQGEETWLEGEKPEACDDWGDRTVAELIQAVLHFGGEAEVAP